MPKKGKKSDKKGKSKKESKKDDVAVSSSQALDEQADALDLVVGAENPSLAEAE